MKLYRIYSYDPKTGKETGKYCSGNFCESLDAEYNTHGDRPKIDCQVKVESISSGHFRITSPVTEIIEETENHVKFKTRNTYYVWERL